MKPRKPEPPTPADETAASPEDAGVNAPRQDAGEVILDERRGPPDPDERRKEDTSDIERP